MGPPPTLRPAVPGPTSDLQLRNPLARPMGGSQATP
ncbi:hypothetical protein AMPC_02000 [Anaeromyxobacter paludicola]|uniref:Uncharacterized protein n=1 Tax=Anaeromyxobacter paludicola TaxID=2918171 RepID=A0ABN6N563_9BACT|nr:hypothetical protein AMPC_02000 [Anaeromyxobacter paludicola]